MNQRRMMFAILGVVLVVASIQAIAQEEETEPMGFFITSVGPGNGADLGGLAGADAHCQNLAEAAGAGNRTWRAYLSTQASGGQRGCQRARSYRKWPLGQRQGPGHRSRRRRPALQQRCYQLRACAQRKG